MSKRIMTAVLWVAAAFSQAAEPPAAAPKPLDRYALADRVWLGTFGGEVSVNPRSELTALRIGEMEWRFADGETVKEGDAVAVSAVTRVRQSAAQLALDESALAMKLKSAAWAHQEKIANLQRQIGDMEGRIAKLALTPKESRLFGEDLSRRLAEERRKLADQLVAMREKLDPEFLAEELRIEQEQLRQDVARAKTEHLELVQSVEILAPNDGVLKIYKTGEVRGGDVVGTVESRGKASVTLQVLDPEIRSEPPDSLAIAVSGPTGEMFPGRFSHVERPPVSRLGPVIYHFTLGENGESPQGEDLSGERMVTLYKLLGRKARIIPKAEFLFSHPADIQRLGWAGFFREIWPDARIIHIGPRSVSLVEQE
jgi:regulator of replication initiation timing